MNVANINPLALPSLPLLNRSQLPNLPAIYFVIAGEQVLYIGQTSSLTRRFLSHHKLKEFINAGSETRIAWLECSDLSLLKQIEYALIKHFAPAFNTHCTQEVRGPKPKWRVTTSINEETIKKLETWAAQEKRSVSSLVRTILREAVKSHDDGVYMHSQSFPNGHKDKKDS